MKKKYIPQDKKQQNRIRVQVPNRLEWTEKQKEFIQIAQKRNTKVMFVKGPAGVSKTFLAVYCALKAFEEAKVSDIIYIRSLAESASKSMGYLPGEAVNKLAPYLAPLEDKLEEFLSASDIKLMKERHWVGGGPVNYLRGAHFADKYVLIDECFEDNVCIETNRGRKRLKAIMKNPSKFKVLSFNEKKRLFEYKAVTNVFEKGVQEISKMHLDGRASIRATKRHRFLTTEGWKRMEEIKVGDGIISSSNNKHSKKYLNEDQKALVVGGVLGDFGVGKVALNSRRVQGTHGIKQYDYASFKMKILQGSVDYVAKNGYSQKPAVRMSSGSFYWNTNGKSLKKHAIDNMSLKSLAISWQDDGYYSVSNKSGRLYSCADNQIENEYLAKKLNLMGYACKSCDEVNGQGVKYFSIRFTNEGVRNLFDDIAPYVHPSMVYKINDINKKKVGFYEWNNNFKEYSVRVVTSLDFDIDKQPVYDIEVEDNHNFVVSKCIGGDGTKIVAHNCQNLDKKELTTIITRLGEQSKIMFLGDPAQSDLPSGKSGFLDFYEAFENYNHPDMRCFEFTQDDIVRSEILKEILKVLSTIS